MTSQNLFEKTNTSDLPETEQPIILKAELKKILFEFNQTLRDYPADKCLHQLFEEQVERTPNAIAVVLEQQELTYDVLNQKANQLAYYLQKLGVKPETLVGLFVERSLEMVIALLGILKAGGAYVPIDPNYPTERIAYMMSDARLSVIVTQHHLVDLLPKSDAQVICLDTDSRVIEGESQQNPNSGVHPKNLAYVIYTSGSTGNPKGVMIEHRSVVNVTSAALAECHITSSDRVLQFSSISFDVAVQEIYPYLRVGGTIVLRTQQMLSSNLTFLQNCWEWKLTVLNLPPAFWHQLIAELAVTKQCLPPCLRLVMIGGERVLPEKLKLWQEYVQQMLNCHKLVESPQLYNAYGPTETTVDATYFNLSSYALKDTLSPVPIGRPIANTQIYILDSELKPVAIGVKGELHIGGVGLARGYLHRPELTTEKFIPNPFFATEEFETNSLIHDSARLYKTGDLCRFLPDGNIEYCGRIDHQVKVRGFRIELGEIEAVLEQHPAIAQAIVIPQEDSLGDKRLIAYIVPDLGSGERAEQDCANNPLQTKFNQQLISQLRGFLQEKLPEYMLPTGYGVLEKLPLTPNDKVNRQALASLPADSYVLSEKTYVAPRTAEEKVLASLWAEVLNLEQVGIHDNFFELGGNSLKVIVLLNRLQEQLSKNFQMVDLLNAPTIAEFTACLEEKSSSPLDTIERVASSPNSDTSYFPPSFFQERFWFQQKLNPTDIVDITPNNFRLTGELDVATLIKSFNEIIRRHEILRTTLQQVNDALMQVVAPAPTVNISMVDLQTLPEQEQQKEIERLTQQEIRRPIALDTDPWWHVTLIRLGEQSHLLQIWMHPLLVDDKSIDILFQELAVLYEAFLSGKPSPLPPLPLQYSNYALSQRQSLTGEFLEAKRNYWKEWLTQEPPQLKLPTDKLLPTVQTSRADVFEDRLSAKLTSSLKTFSQQRQVTLFTTILTAFATFLYRYGGSEDIIVAAPANNRNHWKLEPLIGSFGKVLLLPIHLKGNPSFLELLAQVRQEMLSAIANQDVPFGQLAKTLQLERKVNHPLFRVVVDFLLEPLITHQELPGLSVNFLPPPKESLMRADLFLYLWEENTSSGMQLQVWWRYKKDLFLMETIARMAENFQTVLETMVASPERSIGEFPLSADLRKLGGE
jgi:amino acid adenylation domain-containing protein